MDLPANSRRRAVNLFLSMLTRYLLAKTGNGYGSICQRSIVNGVSFERGRRASTMIGEANAPSDASHLAVASID
jgi:hypothetical protein